jgi:hypothetical protein
MSVVAAGRAHLTEARHRLSEMRGNPSLAEPESVDEALAKIDEA